ncbi:MAG TPA: lysophospholipid acyltransferase family protein [Thermoanaerobaculia bacterium]|nr:lysophospholipid acyltransferase family protein [Thermoanaerobaculia bacterium]
MRSFRERAAFYLGFLVGGVWFFLCSAAGLLGLLLSGGSRIFVFLFARAFCGGMVRLMGWSIEVEHRERLYATRPCVFVGNHQSIMDLLTYGAIVPKSVVAVGKKEIGKIPLFGWFFRFSGNLVIDRGSSEDASRLLADAARRLTDEGVSVFFMPEGHRGKGDVLLSFKTGAFRLAAAAGVPVVPVVGEPLLTIVDTVGRRAHRGVYRFRILEPEPCPGGSDEEIAAAAAAVRARMQRDLDDLRATARIRR